MTRALTDCYQIDGRPMPAPDAEADFSFTDLDASDSGRTEDGVMHRIVVREKVGAWGFAYSHLTDEELAYLKGLFAGKATFQFTHPVFGASNATETSSSISSSAERGQGMFQHKLTLPDGTVLGPERIRSVTVTEQVSDCDDLCPGAACAG